MIVTYLRFAKRVNLILSVLITNIAIINRVEETLRGRVRLCHRLW